MKFFFCSVVASLFLSVASLGQIVVHGISENADEGTTSISIPTSGAQQGDAVIVLSGNTSNNCSVTGASWSAGRVTLDLSVCSGSPTSGTIGVIDMLPTAYNGVYQVVGGTPGSTVEYALASNPGTFISGGQIEPDVSKVTDDSGNIYHEVPGSFSGIVSIWYATNIALHVGGTQPTVTAKVPSWMPNATIIGTIAVAGIRTNNTIDQVATKFVYNKSTVVTPTINGNYTSEFYVAFSGIYNETGNATEAECGTTFTNFNTGNNDSVGGFPAGYYTGKVIGQYCAGLLQNAPGNAWPVIVSFIGKGAAQGSLSGQ